jgi:hypothetical protein
MKQFLFFLLAVCLQGTAQLLYGQNFSSWDTGERAVFELKLFTRVRSDLDMMNMRHASNEMKARFSAVANITCIRKENEAAVFYCSFASMHVELPLQEGELKAVDACLQKGFYFLQKRNGLVDSIYFKSIPPEAAEFLVCQFLEQYQFFIPDPQVDQWGTMIRSKDGLLTARYALIPGRDKNIRLVALNPEYQRPGTALISRHVNYRVGIGYHFNSSGQLTHINGAVTRQAKANHKTITVQHDSIDCRLVSRQKIDQNMILEDNLFRSAIHRFVINDAERWNRQAAKNTEEKAATLHIKSIIGRLEDPELITQETLQDQLAEDIRVIFLAGKDSTEMIESFFLSNQISPVAFRVIRKGLVTSATPASQSILVKYLNQHRNEWTMLKKVLPATGIIRHPSRAMRETILQYAMNTEIDAQISSAAQLAIGNLVFTLRDIDHILADSIALALATFMQKNSENDPLLFLSVIGNCGTSNLLPLLEPYLRSDDSSIRGFTYYALRFMDHPKADRYLENGLQTESSRQVLVNIFNGLYFRKATNQMVKCLENIVNGGRDPISLGALNVLFEWSYQNDELLHNIRVISLHHQSAAVKSVASDFVSKADQ